MENKELPKWATEAIRKGAPEKEIREGKVLSNGVFHKSAVGRTDNEFIVVEKPIMGTAKPTRFDIGQAGAVAGPLIECPSCRSNVRLAHSPLPRSIYCINCGSRLSIGENLSVALMEILPPASPRPPERRPDIIVPKPLAPPVLPFQHNGYTLYTRLVKLKGGSEQRIYFFSRREPRSGTPAAKPEGYDVGVNGKTGLPYLRKGGAGEATNACERREGDDLTLIHGIGHVYEKRLNAAGINTFDDMLKYKPKELNEIASPSKSFGNRAARQRWKAQAERFVSEKRYAKK